MNATAPTPVATMIRNPNCAICTGARTLPPPVDWMLPQFVDTFPLHALLSTFWTVELTLHGRREVTEVVTARIQLDGRSAATAHQHIRYIHEPADWRGCGYHTIIGSVADPTDAEHQAKLVPRIAVGMFLVFGNLAGAYAGHTTAPVVHIIQSFHRYD